MQLLFESVHFNLDILFQTLHGMSTDSQQMYRYCVALETGLYDAFVNLKIGNCSTARWITFGTRILQVYMSAGIRYNAHVAECLERMVNFIVNIYYKVKWASIILNHVERFHRKSRFNFRSKNGVAAVLISTA